MTLAARYVTLHLLILLASHTSITKSHLHAHFATLFSFLNLTLLGIFVAMNNNACSNGHVRIVHICA